MEKAMIFFQQYWPVLLIASYFLYKWWAKKRIIAMLPELKTRGAKFIDVRSPAEFHGGAAPDTINIPLNDLTKRVEELGKTTPIVVCCATGTRSAMAKAILRSKGLKEVYNAGSWLNLR